MAAVRNADIVELEHVGGQKDIAGYALDNPQAQLFHPGGPPRCSNGRELLDVRGRRRPVDLSWGTRRAAGCKETKLPLLPVRGIEAGSGSLIRVRRLGTH